MVEIIVKYGVQVHSVKIFLEINEWLHLKLVKTIENFKSHLLKGAY